jgi:thioredoxin:protein disulfide reductase
VAVKLGYENVYRNPYGLPEWQALGLPVESSSIGSTTFSEVSPGPVAVESFQGWAMFWTLLGVFFGGLALNLTPCVYPMIPITVSFFGGRTALEKPNQVQLVIHGLCYLMGLAVTNSILGVVAALTGGLMGALLQNPIVLVTDRRYSDNFRHQPFRFLGTEFTQ